LSRLPPPGCADGDFPYRFALLFLAECGAENVMVTIHDMGAIEITIRARLETALERASAEEA